MSSKVVRRLGQAEETKEARNCGPLRWELVVPREKLLTTLSVGATEAREEWELGSSLKS